MKESKIFTLKMFDDKTPVYSKYMHKFRICANVLQLFIKMEFSSKRR